MCPLHPTKGGRNGFNRSFVQIYPGKYTCAFLLNGIQQRGVESKRFDNGGSYLSGNNLGADGLLVQSWVRDEECDIAVIRSKAAMLHVLRFALGVDDADVWLHHDVRRAPFCRITELVWHRAQIEHAAAIISADARAASDHFGNRVDDGAWTIGIEQSDRSGSRALVLEPDEGYVISSHRAACVVASDRIRAGGNQSTKNARYSVTNLLQFGIVGRRLPVFGRQDEECRVGQVLCFQRLRHLSDGIVDVGNRRRDIFIRREGCIRISAALSPLTRAGSCHPGLLSELNLCRGGRQLALRA